VPLVAGKWESSKRSTCQPSRPSGKVGRATKLPSAEIQSSPAPAPTPTSTALFTSTYLVVVCFDCPPGKSMTLSATLWHPPICQSAQRYASPSNGPGQERRVPPVFTTVYANKSLARALRLSKVLSVSVLVRIPSPDPELCRAAGYNFVNFGPLCEQSVTRTVTGKELLCCALIDFFRNQFLLLCRTYSAHKKR